MPAVPLAGLRFPGKFVLFIFCVSEQVTAHAAQTAACSEKKKPRKTHKLKATPHKARLTPLRTSCLHIFRHIAPKFLDRREPACEILVQSDEKSDCATRTQSLCGIALTKSRKRNKARQTKTATVSAEKN
ncbi:MAG: hypothetical protein NC131_09320 [Roseburia sp.]|nr:hypothetical protein [Roseburia sp.]